LIALIGILGVEVVYCEICSTLRQLGVVAEPPVSGRRAPSLNTFCVGVAVVVGCVVGVAWGVWLVVVNKIPTIASSNLFLLGYRVLDAIGCGVFLFLTFLFKAY
jgi:hypothetical protein